MLGRLAKWLRVMGFDTHYQPFYKDGMIDFFVQDGRLLLSRNRRIINKHVPSLFVESEKIRSQLQELNTQGYLSLDISGWFTRCLTCNFQIEKASPLSAKTNIPEYVYSQNYSSIKFCPSCGRYFWPGSHKIRMINQISQWLSDKVI